jgi:uncharacterized protein (DUF1684 family)
MKNLLILLFLFVYLNSIAQTDSLLAVESILKFQKELNEEYADPKKSPLEANDLKKFKKHDYFPIDLAYRVVGTLKVTNDESFFKMKTSTDRLPLYRKYGEVTFLLNGKQLSLSVYQSSDLMKREGYKDYLFLPFTDLTNGKTTYKAGRYIELRIPTSGDELVLDFNKAYNPYCAYTDKYSCPIVPLENDLMVEVLAGVKLKNKK